jgi:hypothetical protein
MDGASGPWRSGVATSQKEAIASTESASAQQTHEIFVRAHTSVRTEDQRDRRWSPKWPEYCLIFDTETTLDPLQKLNFGTYRRCKLVDGRYLIVEEGIFYRDDLSQTQVQFLKRYKLNPKTLASVELFPSQTTLGLTNRSSFMERVFWKSVRKGELIVGFNLPFDLSRLATKWPAGKKGDWSLAFTRPWKNPKTGRVVPNPNRPRIIVDAQNSKMAFIRLGSIFHPEEWPKAGRFLDLRTLGWALRNVSYSLESACKAFHVEGKVDHTPSGQISAQEIEYCRGDVAASHRLLNAMMREFNQNPTDLHPDKAYSPASIAKSYLAEMRIKKPKMHLKTPRKTLGIAMQSYYGGRAECRIRRTAVPVIHTDFTSQYPTVNALLGNWDVLTSSSVNFVDCTKSAKALLSSVTLENTFDPKFWKQLSFFALVKPQGDILPVRTVYNGRTQNIGLNYLTTEKPIWYAGPDVIASAILTGKYPKVLKALRMVPHGRQSKLASTNLGGMVAIDPAKDDFYRKVIEQRFLHKKENKALAEFLKVLANSGSYGLFVEVNTETKKKAEKVRYFSGEKKGRRETPYSEKPGDWYFPPLASLITSGGRLLLAMLEKSVSEKEGSYLFCDTDSLCVVATQEGGFIPCEGGQFRRETKAAIKALSLAEVRLIAQKFANLNPYDSSIVREILKIEDINYVDSDPRKSFRQLYGYAISMKRYALYTRLGDEINIEKASGHGLGYLYAPKEREKNEETDDETDDEEKTPEWVLEAWDFLLRKQLRLTAKEPSWLNLPAMMRMVLTTPNILKTRRPEWLGSFNFFLFPIISELGGYPAGFDKSNFFFITPMESDRRKWRSLAGINLHDRQTYRIAMSPSMKQDKVVPDSFRIILNHYPKKAEAKSLAPDGSPCGETTQGLLGRARIVADKISPVFKETDRRWEQGEDPSMLDPGIHGYEANGKMCVAHAADRKQWSRVAVTKLIRESGLSPTTVYKILEGEEVRCYILASFRHVAESITG